VKIVIFSVHCSPMKWLQCRVHMVQLPWKDFRIEPVAVFRMLQSTVFD